MSRYIRFGGRICNTSRSGIVPGGNLPHGRPRTEVGARPARPAAEVDRRGGRLRRNADPRLPWWRVRRRRFARRRRSWRSDIRDVVEAKLNAMLASNPRRMDFYGRYLEIVAEYNNEKHRATIEDTFQKFLAFAASLDAETERAGRAAAHLGRPSGVFSERSAWIIPLQQKGTLPKGLRAPAGEPQKRRVRNRLESPHGRRKSRRPRPHNTGWRPSRGRVKGRG